MTLYSELLFKATFYKQHRILSFCSLKYEFTNVLRRDGKIELKSSGAAPGEIDIWLAFYHPLSRETSCSVYCSVE